MNEKQRIAAKGIAGAINEPVWSIWKIVQIFEDASLKDMSIETALERFQEVARRCQEIERIIDAMLPDLARNSHKPDQDQDR
jgi:hypothetical protein